VIGWRGDRDGGVTGWQGNRLAGWLDWRCPDDRMTCLRLPSSRCCTHRWCVRCLGSRLIL